MAMPFNLTKDGLEQQFGVNNVGHFLLTELLMPALVAAGTPASPSRVVNVASIGHIMFTKSKDPIDWDNLEPREATYREWAWNRYGASAYSAARSVPPGTAAAA